jgi:hypothetical protein
MSHSFEPHQQRVIDERAALHEKIVLLNRFMDGELFRTLDPREQNRMVRQFGWMCGYRSVLDERIYAFTPKEPA